MEKNKMIGALIILFSILLLITFFYISNQLNEALMVGCEHPEGEVCPFEGRVPLEVFVGTILALILIGIGTYFIFSKEKETKPKARQKTPKDLSPEEKKIYKIIEDSEGLIFQGELVKKSGFSKVKTTRILDRLEAKHLIERRRRGMSNVVILK